MSEPDVQLERVPLSVAELRRLCEILSEAATALERHASAPHEQRLLLDLEEAQDLLAEALLRD